MIEKYGVQVVIATLGLGLLGKIVWDWLKNRGSDGIYEKVMAKIEPLIKDIKTEVDVKLDKVIESLNNLNVSLAKNYATQESIRRIWDKIEDVEKEITGHPCQANKVEIQNIKDEIRELKK